MATAAAVAKVKEVTYLWEGKDKSGKVIKGQMRAGGEALVNVTLRRLKEKYNRQQSENQSGIVLPDRNLFCSFLHPRGYLVFGVPGFQGGFPQFGRGSPRPDLVRHGGLDLFRQLLVHHLPRRHR